MFEPSFIFNTFTILGFNLSDENYLYSYTLVIILKFINSIVLLFNKFERKD